jgi:hypothetical protein
MKRFLSPLLRHKTPILTAALLALLGNTAVYAMCATHARLEYDTYALDCHLIGEVNGMCIMECTRVLAFN